MADEKALVLIQEDKPLEFNHLIEGTGGKVDLSHGQFRGYDLRKFHLGKANLSGAYLRNADLRGQDFTHANLSGASIKDAKISGVLFPPSIEAAELLMSWHNGTRLRETQRS